MKIPPKVFAREYVHAKRNGTKAVQKIDPTKSYGVAAVTSSRLLKNVKVQELIESEQERLVDNMKSLAYKAQSEAVRYNATKDLLDRGGSTLQGSTEAKPDNTETRQALLEAIKKGDTVELLRITNKEVSTQ